jgi:hypothetical protein
MLFTENKRDSNRLSLLNKLIDIGGDIAYRDGLWYWNNCQFRSVRDMACSAGIPISATYAVLDSYSFKK